MNKQELSAIFESFKDLNVLIIGDVMIDSYIWGKVNRISPEAPVPIVTVTKKDNRLGGAANVALNVQAMGANPILCSVIGADIQGDLFLNLLKDQKLSQKGILKSRSRITTCKTRIISSNHQMLRIDDEIETDITETETEQLLIRILFLIKKEKVDVVIFEDYDKGLITQPLINKIVTEAKRKKIPIVVDPKKKNFNNYKNITLFKPNLKELREGLKIDIDIANQRQLQKAVDNLQLKQKIEIALVTLSEHGVYISSKTEKELIPAHVRNIADVSGAGDTVVSIAALCLAVKLPPVMLATLTNLAGGLVCEKVGVVPINKKQLFNEALELIEDEML